MSLCALCRSDAATTVANGHPLCSDCRDDYTTPTTEDI